LSYRIQIDDLFGKLVITISGEYRDMSPEEARRIHAELVRVLTEQEAVTPPPKLSGRSV
jgi:hypothetical protein